MSNKHRVELLINRVRRETENEEYTKNTGIDTQEFIDFMNDAQKDLQSAIARQHQNVFVKEKKYDIIPNQESYDLPQDIMIDNRVSYVWYSDTGQEKDNRQLKRGTLSERLFNRSNIPALYIRRSSKLLLSPIPSKNIPNGLTLNYVRNIPTLDIRRAKILSIVLDNNTNTITSFFLDPNADFQREELLLENYMCIVNVLGDQTMRRIPFTNIDAITGEVTVDPSFVFETGETAQAGWYVVQGFDATNRSELSGQCEMYLVSYCCWKIFKRDSSADSTEATQELLSMRSEMVDLYSEVDDDTKTVPITDTQFIDNDDLWTFY